MTGFGTTESIAGMFRRANIAQRAPSQIERISKAPDPVEALLGEDRIYTEASADLRKIVAPHAFHAVPDMLCGRVSRPGFISALKFMLRIDYWDNPEYMSRAVLGRRSESIVLKALLNGSEPINCDIVRRIATQEKPFLSPDERISLNLMGAYALAFNNGSVQALSEFPAAYAHAVRTAVLMEPLAGGSYLSGMYPLADSRNELLELASSLGMADHARPLLEEAQRAEGANDIHLWVPRWTRYFEMSGLSHSLKVFLNRYRGYVERLVPESWEGYYYAGETFKERHELGDARLDYGKALLRLQLDAMNGMSGKELAANKELRTGIVGELCAIPACFNDQPWA